MTQETKMSKFPDLREAAGRLAVVLKYRQGG